MREWKTSGAYQEEVEPAALDAANRRRPNAKSTSLKYIEHNVNVIFHQFQRTNKKFTKTDRPTRYLSI